MGQGQASDLTPAPGEQLHQVARKPSINLTSRKSPSPGRRLPGKMRINFRRSPTPLREVVRYKPEDPAAETLTLNQQLSSMAASPASTATGPTQPSAQAALAPRSVQIKPDKPTARFVPWGRWGQNRQSKQATKWGKAKGKGKKK